jgi:hypothetical protein
MMSNYQEFRILTIRSACSTSMKIPVNLLSNSLTILEKKNPQNLAHWGANHTWNRC